MKKLSIATLITVGMVLSGAAIAGVQYDQQPQMQEKQIRGALVHKISGTVVSVDRPFLVLETERGDERLIMNEEVPTWLEPNAEVTVFYTVEGEDRVARRIEKSEDREVRELERRREGKPAIEGTLKGTVVELHQLHAPVLVLRVDDDDMFIELGQGTTFPEDLNPGAEVAVDYRVDDDDAVVAIDVRYVDEPGIH